ncbi:hypothetical protein SD81_008700 [Tolypothrix campylonemoides VB511288]|nr:hypothetical protein SD81_008700 [Tolypothrix campylonemoides VB511288]
MGRNSKITIAAILALTIASCSSQGDQSSHPTSTNTPAATQKAANQRFHNPVVSANQKPANQGFKNPVVSVNQKAANQGFKNPVVSAKQTPPVITTTANLIQPTNATQRVGVVSKRRKDPFAQIVEPYSIKVTNTPVVVKPVSKLLPAAKSKRQSNVIATTTKNPLNQNKHRIKKTAIKQNAARERVIGQATAPPRAMAHSRTLRAYSTAPQKTMLPEKAPPRAIASVKLNSKRAVTPVLPKVLPQIPNPALASVLPPPQPELARTVFVSGVVLIGKEPQAIIKVPNEATSRYVQAGQRLGNGVLIKRIEINEGSEPSVILEQYGIEVARMVGEGIATQTPPTAASGENPVSLTEPTQNPVPGGAS